MLAFLDRARRAFVRRLWTEPSPLGSVEPWEAFQSQTKWVDKQPCKLNLELPINYESNAGFDFESLLNVSVPPQYLVRVPNGKVFSLNGVVTDAKGQMLRDTYPRTTPAEPYDFAKARPNLPKAKSVRGSLAACSLTHGGNYFHWKLRMLPRLIAAQQDRPDWCFVPKSLPFQKEVLARLGVYDKTIQPDVWSHIVADEVWFPSVPSVAEFPSTIIVKMLRDLFEDVLAGVANPSSRKIYISRDDAKVRRVVNEDEVVDELVRAGFEVVTMHQKSVAQQVAEFASAKVVVAPHGAALTNLAYCLPGTKVVELFSPRYFNPCYWALANAAELDYFYIKGIGEVVEGVYDGNENIKVNVLELRNLISCLG